MQLEEQQQAQMTFATSDVLPELRNRAVTEGVRSLTSVERSRLQRWEWSVVLRMQNHFYLATEWELDQSITDEILMSAANSYPLWVDLDIQIRDKAFADAIEAHVAKLLSGYGQEAPSSVIQL